MDGWMSCEHAQGLAKRETDNAYTYRSLCNTLPIVNISLVAFLDAKLR